MHVSLTPKLEALIHEKVESGLYNNASEVVRDALRLMQQLEELRKRKLERLREEVKKGEIAIAEGRFTRIETEEELEDFFALL